MDANEQKQYVLSQWIGVFLVVFGTSMTGLGCHFHWDQLTTLTAGVVGAGINMLTNQIRNSLTNKSGGNVNLVASGGELPGA